MKSIIRILGIPGSLRQDSYNGRLLEFLQHHSPPKVELTNSRNTTVLPLIFSPLSPTMLPDSVIKFHKELSKAKGVIIATPQHSHQAPSWLKTVIEWGSYPKNLWSKKPVAIIGTSVDVNNPRPAQREIIDICIQLKARVMLEPEINITEVGSRFDSGYEISDAQIQQELLDFYQKFLSFIPSVVH